MAIETGKRAFPKPGAFQDGMTLRDYFAAKALPSIYADAMRDMRSEGYPHDWREGIASDAYRIADAMLAARGAA